MKNKKQAKALKKKRIQNKPTEIEEVKNAGKLAAKQGKSRRENPYKEKTEEHDAWLDGFECGLRS